MSGELNPEYFRRAVVDRLRVDTEAAAEPVIREAVATFERELRAKLAVTLLAVVDLDMNMERYGPDLRVTIRHRTQ